MESPDEINEGERSENANDQPERNSLILGFEFYFQFAGSLVLDLPSADEKAMATSWVQKLRESLESISSEEIRLRLDYLKLLLFVLQRRHLIGIFRRQPPNGVLEPFPHCFNISDMSNMLLELDENRPGGGDSRAAPYTIEISNDLKEFVAAQEIPHFGVQVYHVWSTDDPIHKWSSFDETKFPKYIREKIRRLKVLETEFDGTDELKSASFLLGSKLEDLNTSDGKCSIGAKSPQETEKSQERCYQAYVNLNGGRGGSNLGDKCNEDSDKSWQYSKKVKTTKKVLPNGTEISVTKIDQDEPLDSDSGSRNPLRLARSTTLHEVEVKGRDEDAVEAAAQKQLEELMKQHCSTKDDKYKTSGNCECPGHNRKSVRCGPEALNMERFGNNCLDSGRRHAESSNRSSRPLSNIGQPSSRSPSSNERLDRGTEGFSAPCPPPQRFRNPCGMSAVSRKMSSGNVKELYGSNVCCPCSKNSSTPPPPPPPPSCQRGRKHDRSKILENPCPGARPRTSGFEHGVESYGENSSRGGTPTTDERQRERIDRLRRISELQAKRESNMRDKCSQNGASRIRSCSCRKEHLSDSDPVRGSRSPARRPQRLCYESRQQHRTETEVKSICNKTKTTKSYKRLGDGGEQSPIVTSNKTCIVEKSEKIVEPCSKDKTIPYRSPYSSGELPSDEFDYQEDILDRNIADEDKGECDFEVPFAFEQSIKIPESRRNRHDGCHCSPRSTSPRFTSTPKSGGHRSPHFPGDVTRIPRRLGFTTDYVMSPPNYPDLEAAFARDDSVDSDIEDKQFIDDLTGISPEDPPNQEILNIRDFLCERLDLSAADDDNFVEPLSFSRDETFSSSYSPANVSASPPASSPIRRPNQQRPSRPLEVHRPPPGSMDPRPGYVTPPRRRPRMDRPIPQPAYRPPSYIYSPIRQRKPQAAEELLETSDSSAYEFNPRRNLMEEFEKLASGQKTPRNRTSVRSRFQPESDAEETSDCENDYGNRGRPNDTTCGTCGCRRNDETLGDPYFDSTPARHEYF